MLKISSETSRVVQHYLRSFVSVTFFQVESQVQSCDVWKSNLCVSLLVSYSSLQ